MDLRGRLSESEVVEAIGLLQYQPFILSDDVQVGAGWSWANAGDPTRNPRTLFHKADCPLDMWHEALEVNGRVRAMYDDMLDEVARRFPGGTLLDVACNNGYFPVGAELRGMRGTGMDKWDFSRSVAFLNHKLGTRACFFNVAYDPITHKLPDLGEFDVTVMSAIMCHLPDPVYFLTAVARVTRRALLFWGQMIESDGLFISYLPPHPTLPGLPEFPHSFNDNTRISRGLFSLTLNALGFREIVEVGPHTHWWKDPWAFPKSFTDEMAGGSRHQVLLALR